jgi:hypothetical protein
LRLLLETDIALVLGSEDTAYSPSKLYPTLLASKPTLAIAPQGSVLESLIQVHGGAALVRCGASSKTGDGARVAEWLRRFAAGEGTPQSPEQREALYHDHSAQAVAERQLVEFRRVLAA